MKTCLGRVTFLLLLLGAPAATAQAPPRPSFTGTFEFDPQASRLQVPQPTAMVFRFVHEEPRVELSRTRSVGGQTDTWSVKLTTDGKELVQRRDDSPVRYRLYWRDAALVLDSSAENDGKPLSNVVVYTLSDDGRTLTALERFRGPKLTYENTWVLRRKPETPASSDARQ
jgi:hypothetical protein